MTSADPVLHSQLHRFLLTAYYVGDLYAETAGYTEIFTELEALAKVQYIKRSNVIEEIVTSDDALKLLSIRIMHRSITMKQKSPDIGTL